MKKNVLVKYRYSFLILAIIGIFLNLFATYFYAPPLIICFFLFWLGTIFSWNLDGNLSIFISLFFLLICFLSLIFGQKNFSAKAATWFYLFIVAGVLQEMVQLFIGQEEKLITLKEVVSLIRREYINFRQAGIQKYTKALVGGLNNISRASLKYLDSVQLEVKRDNGRIKNFLVKIFFPFLRLFLLNIYLSILFFFLLLIWVRFIREVLFYRSFFEEFFLFQFYHRVLIWLLAFWGCCLAVILATRLKRKIFGHLVTVILLIFVWRVDLKIFSKAREGFEFRPYTLRIKPNIASRYMEVEITGRNFQDMPFRNKVLIDGREQRIKSWVDKRIVIEIDPSLSTSGDLKIVGYYGNRGMLQSNPIFFTFFDPARATPEEEKAFWEAVKKQVQERANPKFD